MARKRVLSAMSAAIAFLPIVLSPAPVLAGPESLLLPVGHAKVEVLHTTAASKHGHEVSMPSRPADPDGLKAAKARAESGASREVKANSLKAEAVVAAGAPCSSVTQTVSPASPQPPGTTVTFTATATGCPNPTYQFWLLPPGGSWTVVQAYSSGYAWSWNTSGIAMGTYTEDVYARDATSTAGYDTYLSPAPTYTVEAPVCTSVSESATPASPQSPGPTVAFTASATGCPNPTYQFWLLPPGGGWSVTQAYSSSNTWNWSTSGVATGTYTLDVYARDASSTAAYDAHISPNPTYVLNGAAAPTCTSVTESANPVSPQAAGATVKFTATATGCPNPLYQFWLQAPGGGWSVAQAYSSNNIWNWSTSGLGAGTYAFDVYARDASSTAAFDAHISPNPTYVLTASSTTCATVTETATPASPQSAGTAVKFAAGATGCPNPTYQFWLQAPGGGWSVAQAYSASNTWNWSTSGLGAGTYTLDVYARDATSTAAYDAHLSPNPTYVLNAASTTCTSVTEAATPASPQSPGATVKFTASATGCPNPTFQFWLQAPGGGWSVTQAYSSNNIWSWSTSGLATGTYTIDVYARDASSTATFDAHISPNPTYELSAGPACASVSETAIPASPQSPGTTVKFTATATGCPNPTYQFWFQAPGGGWSVVQAYSSNNTWTWSTTGLAGGTYLFDVYARQNGSTASYEAHISPNPSYRLAPGWHATDAPGISAVDEGFCCVPPDTTGAIGPSNYVEIINTTVAVYDRSLNLVGSLDLASFSGAGTLNVSDPNIQWDPRSGRWIYSLISFTSNFSSSYVLFGWSKTADPTNLTSGWCQFGIGSGSMLPDYPKLGHDDNFIVIGANVYDMSKSTQPFVTAQIYAMSKPAAGSTSCTAPTAHMFADSNHLLKNSDGSLAFTPVPTNTVDASQNGFIVAAHTPTLAPNGPQAKIMTWHLVRQGSGTPALSADGDLTVGTFDVPAGVPQPGGAPLIDSLDGRLTQAVAHADPSAGGAEAVWTQHTINGPGGRSVLRWYELLPATHAVRQQGQVTNATDFVFNGAISPSIAGNDAVVFYNRGGSSQPPVIAGQGHSAAAVLGTLDSGETVLATSTASDTDLSCAAPYGPPCRWGDYAGASPDPMNSGVVWGTGEWSGPSTFGFPGWGTQNFALAT
ncbi:MAG: hypothetical protein AUH69_05285 [Actinobacteria bacterium 13_1_40CM_4_65_12]|nr:MAG: hypothetical protein AUH69_05285 [Actinobacteria bacterium 13_1_40CM_4_65_12]